jgi:hypothetical protein
MKLPLTFQRPRFFWLKKVYILWARNFYIKKTHTHTHKHTTLREKHGRFGGGEIPPTFSFLPRKKERFPLISNGKGIKYLQLSNHPLHA